MTVVLWKVQELRDGVQIQTTLAFSQTTNSFKRCHVSGKTTISDVTCFGKELPIGINVFEADTADTTELSQAKRNPESALQLINTYFSGSHHRSSNTLTQLIHRQDVIKFYQYTKNRSHEVTCRNPERYQLEDSETLHATSPHSQSATRFRTPIGLEILDETSGIVPEYQARYRNVELLNSRRPATRAVKRAILEETIAPWQSDVPGISHTWKMKAHTSRIWQARLSGIKVVRIRIESFWIISPFFLPLHLTFSFCVCDCNRPGVVHSFYTL